MFTNFRNKGLLILTIVLVAFLTACGNNNGNGNASPSISEGASENAGEGVALSGKIEIDGSSTVFPITEAVAEEFIKDNKDVKPTVGVSGTGGGFKRFCNGETAISDASRPIKDEEKAACQGKGIEYVDLSVAYDGLSVVVSKENDFVDHLTIEELAKIFGTEGTAKTWADVRAGWPAEEIKLYSPGADSGTFDYFNEAVLDKKGVRNDTAITFSEDDNTLVQGVEGSKNAIGYFGYAYFEENQDKLKVVPIDAGKGAITPTGETIKDGTYAPLSRPLFIYVNKKELERMEVKAFVDFYMASVPELAAEVGYIALPQEKYDEETAKLQG